MPTITPFLWLDGTSRQAAEFYAAVFGSEAHDQPMGASVEVLGQQLLFLDGGPQHQLTPAFSLMVSCQDQGEVDHYWDALLDGGGEPGRCGWLVDRFGVSWQVVPTTIGQWLGGPDAAGRERAQQAMFAMSKLDEPALRSAYLGENA
jgi:predicted 3-demethylubiquinone-9 3-methyltransferase (glyoxalase superfamily)